ncbi:hypothetical protein ABT124_10490 [Streptomyces sp. NPDC001982]|uniref:esterase/lipase family protein n=1 Tax=Streptomyces sp. NPDC001982 TaxID=3154405 RepID=UPI00331B06A1
MQPDTIVLVHGFWMTPRAWENWIVHYENKGFRVIAPPYPGFEVEVEALNTDPTPIETVTVPAIISSSSRCTQRSPGGGAFSRQLGAHLAGSSTTT